MWRCVTSNILIHQSLSKAIRDSFIQSTSMVSFRQFYFWFNINFTNITEIETKIIAYFCIFCFYLAGYLIFPLMLNRCSNFWHTKLVHFKDIRFHRKSFKVHFIEVKQASTWWERTEWIWAYTLFTDRTLLMCISPECGTLRDIGLYNTLSRRCS